MRLTERKRDDTLLDFRTDLSFNFPEIELNCTGLADLRETY